MVQSSKEFQVAGSAFLKAFNRLKGNPSMLQAAMHMFGRHGASSQAWKRTKDLRRAPNCAGPSTATQPTSRKVKLGGRRRLTAGSPKKNVATVDHRYSNPNRVKSPSKTQSSSSCRGVSQQPKTMDAPPPSPPLHSSWTLDQCPPYHPPSPPSCPSTHNSPGAVCI